MIRDDLMLTAVRLSTAVLGTTFGNPEGVSLVAAHATWANAVYCNDHTVFTVLPPCLVFLLSDSRRLRLSISKMASAEAACYTVVTEDNTETPSTSDLRSALQKGSDEVKLDTLRKIIVSTINGNPQVRPSKCWDDEYHVEEILW